jgi:NAD(P)-dependent dehydrogenase (short-subunit alcohol dehydrogenase family)
MLTDRLFTRLRALMESEGIDEQTAKARFTASFGVKRLGTPEDIASLVAFLVSPDATFFQGALIDIDGGMYKAL